MSKTPTSGENVPHAQRVQAVFEASDRPLSADEVRQTLGMENIGQATVYRVIRKGVDAGWLKPVHVPGTTPRYEEAKLGHHHHFACNQCGKVYDLTGCPGGLQKLLPKGFQLESHEILLYGQCADCA